ncbi:MAG: hypothetical protein ACD_3C00123G0010 [uncultured bacterium (gcode 4)]|uniref:Uncharacterized protein n=1 Tax=uncultured bacterium (gcode 4) TaxID=1234023 RepID=K2GCG3_9BACT|nr:MAG: hypothetical protein ACD_3C00123G0010 [uncultured bacterium (gcode 4)]
MIDFSREAEVMEGKEIYLRTKLKLTRITVYILK